jgi:hypothetical protein
MENMFESKKKVIERWLDQLIHRMQALENTRKCSIDGIEACGFWWDGSIHIYHGLEVLAFYLQKTVIYNGNWTDDAGRMYFDYNGHKVFELWKKKEVI